MLAQGNNGGSNARPPHYESDVQPTAPRRPLNESLWNSTYPVFEYSWKCLSCRSHKMAFPQKIMILQYMTLYNYKGKSKHNTGYLKFIHKQKKEYISSESFLSYISMLKCCPTFLLKWYKKKRNGKKKWKKK